MKTRAILIVCAVAAFGCGDPAGPAPDPVTLGPSDWYLVAMRGRTLVDAPVLLTVRSDDLAGHTGCNYYGARYRAEGDRIELRDLVATEQACVAPAGIGAQEQAYLELLNQVRHSAMRRGRLVLLDGAGAELLEFAALEAQPT